MEKVSTFIGDQGEITLRPGARIKCVIEGEVTPDAGFVRIVRGNCAYALSLEVVEEITVLSRAPEPLRKGEAVFFGSEQFVRRVHHAAGPYAWLSLSPNPLGPGILAPIERIRRENGIPIKIVD